jgi:hypothetical protein
MPPSPDTEPLPSAELSKEHSVGWQLDEQSGAWVQREAPSEPPVYQRPDPERIALGEEGRREGKQGAEERVLGRFGGSEEVVGHHEWAKVEGGGEGIVPVHVHAVDHGGDGKPTLEILAKESVSWVADGVLRENSYGDYREVCKPLPFQPWSGSG